jgi:ribose/xylose/arabinose/galactoside ABC-type transport system permease subunit
VSGQALSSPNPSVRGSSAVQRVAARIVSANEVALVVVLVVLSILIGLKNGNFWSSDNWLDIARNTSFTLIVAVAATLVLVSGSLDLSVGSVYALGGVFVAEALTHGVPVVPSIALGLAGGGVAGLLNGLLITRLRVPALIATLGTLYAGRGLVLVITSGAPVYPLPQSFVNIGVTNWLGVPIPVWVAAGVLIAGHLCLSRTVFGRRIYAIGSNETAAMLAGIPVTRIRLLVFILSGAAAALGGILVSARIASAQTTSGQGLELTVIAAVIIGGTSLFGGSGSVVGTLLGALLISVISNGLVLVRIDPFYQQIVVGGIIVAAVAFDGWRRRRLAER